MKRLIAVLLALLLTVPAVAFGAERADLQVSDYLAEQAQIDAFLIAEGEAGYAFESPLVVLNPYGNAPLSAVAIFTTEEEIGGTVTARGKAAEDDITGSFEAAKIHYVPVYGLYAGGVTDVVITLDDGRSTTVQVETEAINTGLTDYQVTMHNAQLYNYDQLTVCAHMILHSYTAYDSKGDLRWMLTGTGANAITLLENGHFMIPNIHGHGAEFPNGLTGVREIDPMGKVYNVYVWNGGEHHEIIEMPNGNIMITSSLPGYVTDRDYVVEIDPATGEVVWELDMADVIEPGASGGWSDSGRDWCHNNALAYDEASDTLLVSCRHSEAVVAVRKETKELLWIFGDPAGWDAAYADYLFTPIGDDFGWAYGQHQLTLLENGDLLLFDNGEYGRTKLVDQDQALATEDNYSRAVIYRLDTENMTAEEIWAYGEELGSSHYAGSMSGVQLLDEAQQSFLVDFGTCVSDAGTKTFIHYIVNDELIWDINYVGNSTYRAYRYDLYTGAAYTPGVQGKWLGDMGETVLIEGVTADIENAQAMPEGVVVELYPFEGLRFSGSFDVASEEELTDYAVVLVASNGEQLAYDLAYTKSQAEDGFKVSLSRWVSLLPLEDDCYAIYLVVNGETWDSGLNVQA